MVVFYKLKQTRTFIPKIDIITDGLPAYRDAFNKEFYTKKEYPGPEHGHLLI